MTDRVRRIASGLAVLVSAAALTPADATVTFIEAGAYSQTRVGIGSPDTIQDGPSDLSSDFATDPYVVSRSDGLDERFQARVNASSAGAGSFDRPDRADFFVRTSVDAEALAHQVATHGAASAGAYYDFSVDTESTLSFTIDTVPVSASPTANVTVEIFSLDALGLPSTYFRQGYFAGRGTSSYTLPPGAYGFALAAFSEGTVPADLPHNGGAISSASANLSLSILSPPAPVSGVPEPATWAMTLTGFGLTGGIMRRNRGRTDHVRKPGRIFQRRQRLQRMTIAMRAPGAAHPPQAWARDVIGFLATKILLRRE